MRDEDPAHTTVRTYIWYRSSQELLVPIVSDGTYRRIAGKKEDSRGVRTDRYYRTVLSRGPDGNGGHNS